jgi:hypothetical protein
MPPIRLNTPRYRIVLGDPEDPATWTELFVQAIGRDLQHAETLFHRRRWGSPQHAAIKFQAASAYYALKRTGAVEGEWEAFESEYLEVSDGDDTTRHDDDEDGDDVGPTDQELEPG